jgi:hypothetical protein
MDCHSPYRKDCPVRKVFKEYKSHLATLPRYIAKRKNLNKGSEDICTDKL